MRFEEALAAMRAGKRIKRDALVRDDYLFIEKYSNSLLDKSCHFFYISGCDLMAEDWEIVE